MTGLAPLQATRLLQRADRVKQVLAEAATRNWLSTTYSQSLYGGWKREDGSRAPPHRKAMEYHEAGKSCFCPSCYGYLGQMDARDDVFVCEPCGLECVLPPVDREGGDWLLSGPSFSKHFPLTLCPYFEQAMASYIVDTVKNQQKCPTQYVLDIDGRIERVHCLSYEQFLKIGRDQTNPFEGPRWKGALFDEPPPRGVWIATKRGLMKWRSRYVYEPSEGRTTPYVHTYDTLFIGGGNQSSKSYTSRSDFNANILGNRPWDGSTYSVYGRAQIAATPLECPWLLHDIYLQSFNKGGENRGIFSMEFAIHDNPAMTKKAISVFEEGMSPEEREARIYGRFRVLSGRVFPEFRDEAHLYQRSKFDPLREGYDPKSNEPSDVPVIMAIDPHYRKPWAMVWLAVMKDGSFYVVDEWPKGPYERMRNCTHGFDEYAAIIREVEAQFPGGSERVIWRELDPNLSRTPHGGVTLTREMRQQLDSNGQRFRFRDDVNDKVNQGHAMLHTLLAYDKDEPIGPLNHPRYFVDYDPDTGEGCRNTYYSFGNYTWDEYQDETKALKDKPKDLGKDNMDVQRYCVMRNPKWRPWQGAAEWYSNHVSRRIQRHYGRAS